jgi:hypothetical protein
MLRTCLVTAPSSALRERNHTMKDLLFLLSDLWMIAACYMFGWRFIRRYGNYLLGLEMAVVGTSGTNFLFWSLLSGDVDSPFYRVAYFFDAFSRSFGATLILVLGLMAVTHRYKPSRTFDVGVFGLAALGGLALGGLHDDTLHVGVATFYVVMNLLTTLFLAYFAKKLWEIGARSAAIWTTLVTAAATFIAVTYDFFPLPFDDADRTIFYTLALTTWGAQAVAYFYGYRAMHEHNAASGANTIKEMGAWA